MAKSFLDLKQNTPKSLEKISEQLAKVIAPTFANDDDRFWTPEVDKSGNGYAVIRFLDSPKGEDSPFVRLWEHRFKGPTGSWYIEKCLTSLGKQDPVAERNSMLWNSGLESDKALARERKRRLYFLSNVRVIKDPQRPEREGKVWLLRYGIKIYDKVNDQMNPPGGEQKINPFDLWNGANFRMKIRTVEGFRNYDMSGFDRPGPIAPTDEEIEAIWKQEYPLQPFLDEKSFKTYDELKTRLERVLGSNESDVAKVTAKALNGSSISSETGSDDSEGDEDEDGSVDSRLRFFEQMKREQA
jgi:gp32-like DNA binding protein